MCFCHNLYNGSQQFFKYPAGLTFPLVEAFWAIKPFSLINVWWRVAVLLNDWGDTVVASKHDEMIKLAEVTNWVVQKNGSVGEKKKEWKHIFLFILDSVYKRPIVLGYRIQPTEEKWLYRQLGNFTLNFFSFVKWYIFHMRRCLFLFADVFFCQENSKCRTKEKCIFRDWLTLSVMFLVPLTTQLLHPCLNNYPLLLADTVSKTVIFEGFFCFRFFD